MTFIDLLLVIVGIVLGYLLAPFVVPHLTGQTTIGLVLTYFLALLTGIGIWIVSIMLRAGLQQITHKPKRNEAQPALLGNGCAVPRWRRSGRKMMNTMVRQLAAVLGVAALVSGCVTDKARGRSAAPPPAYVRCVGQLTDLEPDYPWFENWVDPDGNDNHADGSSPRAVFRIVSPANHADRIVGVLYRYQGKDLPPPPDAGAKGKTFSLELPEDFFTGDFVTIDNSHVRNLKKEPEPEAGGYPR